MKVLALDTTGAACSVSICDAGAVLAHKREIIGRGHAERLAPMVAEALSQADLKPMDIDRLAVCTGPGSFTGLRVALAFAKGFALPRKLPVIGLSSLELWAREHDPEGALKIVSISDVRRGQICWALFDKGQMPRAAQTQEARAARAQIKALAPDHIIEDAPNDTRILAWLGAHLSPQDYLAVPLYSRPPDAKLAGGKTLPQ